jgi:hypothetical protein
MMIKTHGRPTEEIANDFDSAIFNLAEKAYALAERHPNRCWQALAADLTRARQSARAMMTERQRRETAS